MATRKTKPLFVNHLLEAVKHVSHAQTGKGPETATHSMIRYGQIIASDRTLAAGAPVVEDDLDCCPQTERLRLALERCGEEHQIVQEASELFVRSGDFSAFVPLCDPSLIPTPVPDERVAPLGDTFRAALKVTGALVRDNAPTVIQSAIQLNAYSCVSTNGNVIVEAWHGFDMPPGLMIPKGFADAVCKIRKKIAGFGFSPSTFTIHFEDRSWLRTILYRDKMPDIVGKLVAVAEQWPIDPMFFRNVEEIAKWSQDGKVYLHDFLLSSHPPTVERTGSVLTYPTVEMRQGICYSIASLKLISKIATHFNDRTADGVTMFFGVNLRGAVAQEPIDRQEPQQEAVDDLPKWTRVVNKTNQHFDVDITRQGGKWGNPFSIGFDKAGTREQVIQKYKQWILTQPALLAATVTELKGKRLGCVCKPEACHGDVLAELADNNGHFYYTGDDDIPF